MNNVYAEVKQVEQNLKKHVIHLAKDIGERNYVQYKNLETAADYIFAEFKKYGYEPYNQFYTIEKGDLVKRKRYRNVIAEKKGNSEIIVIGAHYDSVLGSPGADDNASAVAGLLEIARLLKNINTKRTIQFVAFTNEEPPFFYTENMGSRVFAREARKNNEKIVAMITLEMIGYYTDKKQKYPLFLGLFYPDKGNYIGIVSDIFSYRIAIKIKRYFKQHSAFPVQMLIAPRTFSAINLSDNSSFWIYGYKAVMITDTAYFRNPNYHSEYDLPETLNYKSMAEVVDGLSKAVLELVNE
ncbi:MAG: M20/M25/M40 family metallo-hydrolase [Elusimicrobiota bacterium]